MTEPGIEGDYLVEGPDEDGSLRLRPEPSLQHALNQLDARVLSEEEAEEELGHLPTSAEG